MSKKAPAQTPTPKEFCSYIVGIEWRGWYQEVFEAVLNPDIKLILLNLIRQSGKSTLLFLIVLYLLFNKKHFQGAVVASSKDTVKSIFRQKLSDPISRSTKLKRDAKLLNESISVPRLLSHCELFPSESVGGLVGRSLNMLFLDECCLIPDESIASALPSVLGQKDGKVIAISSSWSPNGYFYETIMEQEKHPSPYVYMYRSDRQDLNPSSSSENLDFMSRQLIKINKAYERRFLSTEFAELGNEFLPREVVDGCINYELMNKASSEKPCYAFLDLSLKRDLTSRTIVEVDNENYKAVNLQTFDPQSYTTGRIDFDEIKAMIESDFERFRIYQYYIDERAEAGELIQWSRQKGLHLEPFNATVKSNMAIWGRLCELLADRKLIIPSNKRLLDELYNLRIEEFSFGRSFRVVDGSKKLHRDLSMSLAGACYFASEHRGVTPEIFIIGGSDDAPSNKEACWIPINDFSEI